MTEKLDNKKPFERFAQKWAETLPPSKPCKSDLMVYKKSDPTNPEVYFLKALYYAMEGETNAILPALQKAADNGFKDVKRLENNAYFSGFRQTPIFRKILLRVKENKKTAEER